MTVNKPHTKTTVYIIDLRVPVRTIRVRQAVITGTKWRWADVNGKRHLIGSSAFFTLAAAQRSQRGLLEQIVKTRCLQYIHPHLYSTAKLLLERSPTCVH